MSTVCSDIPGLRPDFRSLSSLCQSVSLEVCQYIELSKQPVLFPLIVFLLFSFLSCNVLDVGAWSVTLDGFILILTKSVRQTVCMPSKTYMFTLVRLPTE